jgi:predicted permease
MRLERWIYTVPLRLRSLLRRRRVEQELDEELRYHLERQIEENIARGLSSEEARYAALRAMGGIEQHKEACRDTRRVRFVEDFVHDVRFGLRTMLNNRGLTSIAVLSLSLGIGANTALFSVVDAMLLKTLPVKEPERLVLFRTVAPPDFSPGEYSGYDSTDAVGQRTMTSFPHQSYLRVREQRGALSDVFAFGDVDLSVSANGRADVASGQVVSGNYYAGLGVTAMLGRTLTDADDIAGAGPVAVLSHRYWQRRFGGDPSVVGKPIDLNKIAFTIVGVTPPGFEGTMQAGSTTDVTIPIAWEPRLHTDPKSSRMYGAGEWWLRVMGRLKPGATVEQARGEMESAFRVSVAEHRGLRQTHAHETGGNPVGEFEPRQFPRLFLDPGGQGEMDERERYAQSLYLLVGVVGMVLLIACANVANLLLSRAAARQKEVSVRLALGASRWRLVRQLLTESVLLACLGGAVGIVFALWIKDGLLAVTDWGGSEMQGLEPQLDWRVLSFTCALSILTGIVFGLAPAWRATKVDLAPALKASGRSSSAGSRTLLSRGLVVLQVAVSLVLLVSAGLFVRTLLNLQRIDPGFNMSNVLLFDLQPELIGYKDERLAHLYQQLAERLEAVPGVQKVAFSRNPLLARVRSTRSVYLRDSWTSEPDANGRIRASGQCHINVVRENFLEAMEIPLLAGRPLDARDDEGARKVVVVNQAFAEKFFPDENPLGKQFSINSSAPDQVEIVGLARDAKYRKQRDDVPPTAYVPWRQPEGDLGEVTFELRTSGDPTGVVAAVREAAAELDENLPLANIRTQVEEANRTLAMERLFAKLVTLFGLIAQQLTAIGLFGVMAYSVAQRTREIGIRMALGADRRAVLAATLRQGMVLALMGVALGLAGAYAFTRFVEGWMNVSPMLYGVGLSDPLTYGFSAALLTFVALLACWVPARRATRVDPMVALRCE